MSSVGSASSKAESTAMPPIVNGALTINGYRFKSATLSNLGHAGTVDYFYGYKLSNKSPVVAKVSTNAFQLEREFYVIKKLYQKEEAPLYLVRPIQFVSLPSGLRVAIYANEGDALGQHLVSENDTCTTTTTTTTTTELCSSSTTDTTTTTTTSKQPCPFASYIDDIGEFLRLAIQCTDCLEFIHRHGVIHGEIRPTAFQWVDDGNKTRLKLWNFGSASKPLDTYLTTEGWRRAANSKETMRILQDLLVCISPEQTGRTTFSASHRSDIYSLGILFYVLLTGRNPFDGGPIEIINSIVSRKITLIHDLRPDVPEVLSRIIEKMTNKAPDDRYVSAHGVQADLAECLKRLSTTASSSSDQLIPSFPLGQRDIASVFTLPKSIYGRQKVLSQMTYFVQRFMGTHKSVQAMLAPASNSTPTTTGGTTTDSMSDFSGGGHDGNNIATTTTTAKPTTWQTTAEMKERAFGSGNARQATTIVGIYGPGGIGKSTVFLSVQATARQYGYVSSIKFDSRTNTPYGGFIRSVSQILQQILSEPEEETKLFSEYFLSSLGAQSCNIHLLINLIPELRSLLYPDDDKKSTMGEGVDDDGQADSVETRVRFQNLFVEVIRSISNWHLLTLFFDDLHLADISSIELIQSLVAARVPLLLCVSYRDKEVTQPLAELLANDAADTHLIQVDALDMDSVIDFLCDTLHRPRDVNRQTIEPLAEIVYKRTMGNAFYAAQLIRALERKKLIYFDHDKNEWDFQLEEIQKGTGLQGGMMEPDSLLDVSFLVARLKELPRNGQQLLKYASFVGDTFSWSTVRDLMLGSDVEDDSTGSSEGSLSIISEESDTSRQEGITVTYQPAQPTTTTTAQSGMRSDTNSTLPSLTDNDESGTMTYYSSSSGTGGGGGGGGGSGSKQKLRALTGEYPSSSSSRSSSSKDPLNGLHAVLQEGYIIPIQSDEFKWCHDRLSQAAMELADPATRSKIHFRVAQRLMKESTPNPFLIADHLLKCMDILKTMDDNERYKNILVTAGNRGRASGAHTMSFSYFMGAIRLIKPHIDWDDDHYTTTLNLYTNAVSLSWVVGEYDKTEELLQEIFLKARHPLDRMTGYRIKSKYLFSMQQFDKGLDALTRCLYDLTGKEVQFKASREEVDEAYDQVDGLVKKIGIDNISNVGPCEDPLVRGIMWILEEVCTVAYWIGDKVTMYYWACQIIKLSMDHGMSNVSGAAFTFVGLGYVEVYRQHSYAERIGYVGIEVADKYSTIYEKGRIYFLYTLFLLQWKTHCREQLDWYNKSYPTCVSAGDRIYAAYSQLHIAVTKFLCGYHAEEVAPVADECYNEARSWSSASNTNLMASGMVRVVKALQGRTYTDTPHVFDGDDGFNDEHFISECYKESTHPKVPHSWYASFKLIALVLYGHIDAAIETGYFCFENIDSHPCHKHLRVMLCYFSLALVAKLRDDADDLSPEQRATYREQIEINQQLIDDWAIHSHINYRMYWTFVEAELAAMDDKNDLTRTIELYEEALEQAREGDWILEITVINEFAGAAYERKGLRNMAFGFINKAIDLYHERGYHGKVKHLKAKHRKLLDRYGDKRDTSHEAGVQTDAIPFIGEQAWSTSSHDTPNVANQPYTGTTIPPVMSDQTLMTLDIIDMTSILKSSHVMSSEVKFEGLLTSMMNILLDSTGAECCAVITEAEKKFGVSAYASQEKGTSTYESPRPIMEEDDQISARVIHHTRHTKKSIFIYDVAQDPRFAIGPWFDRVGPSSIICMPIVHKGDLMGCLFMEGPVGIFTQRHISVLALLCQQMGISISNANLFKSLQQVSTAYAKMIEAQKQSLKEIRRSKEAADKATRLREMFLANMSHEIRTPFASFYGMITLLSETRLDEQQYDMVMVAKESCEILLRLIDDLLNFSKLQAGKVTLELAPMVVEDVIADVIEMLTGMAMQKRLNLTHIIAHDVPSVIISDSNRLRQILINLLGNAIKFTHEGEVVIRCSVENAIDNSDDKLTLRFEVIDTGIGITNEQQKALFVPFSQVDGSTTRKYGGTGLGLSICLQLVDLMSGKIELDSVPDQGSNFHFTIPTSMNPETSRAHDATLSNLTKELRNKRVLVTSRHKSTSDMIRAMLRDVDVDCVNNLEDLRALDPTHYSIIIVGVFFVQVPDFELWMNMHDEFFKHVECVMVVHYPSGIWTRLGSNTTFDRSNMLVPPMASTFATDNPRQLQQSLDKDKELMEATATTSTIVTNHLNQPELRRNTVSRISLPFRRQRLLQNLVDTLQQCGNREAASLATHEETPSSSSSSLQVKQPLKPSSTRPGLPLRKTTSGNLPPISEEQREIFSTKHILIAEDNAVAQKLLYKQLTRLSLNVECANNGMEAIEAWKQHPPAYFTLAFFDHHMPKCDGVQATKIIRDMESSADPPIPRLPIIAVTADIQDSARQTCMKAGMDAYMTKPVNQQKLLDTLLYYCKNSR